MGARTNPLSWNLNIDDGVKRSGQISSKGLKAGRDVDGAGLRKVGVEGCLKGRSERIPIDMSPIQPCLSISSRFQIDGVSEGGMI